MRKEIHPKYFPKAKVTCACGNEFTTGSTLETIKVEICHLCHPFYTGKQKLVDTARRVEKFQDKLAKSAATVGTRIGKKAKKVAQVAKRKAATKEEK